MSSDKYFSINVKTFKKHFDKIRRNLINIIIDLTTKKVKTESYITLYSDFTAPLNGNAICKKIQEKFNVVIS
jgi:hypothetical protein